MIFRSACAALLLAGFAAAPASADLSRLPGSYQAGGEDNACRMRLDAAASAPQDSLVEAETLSGLVLAFPGCPAGLSDAVLWRAPADGSSLSLIDGSGAVILEVSPGEGRSWSSDGAAVTLRPA